MPIYDQHFHHCYLVVFNIPTGRISFYDSFESLNIRYQDYFQEMKNSLSERFPQILHTIGWFESRDFDPSCYQITFHHPSNVPQQSGHFGDCGPLVLLFMKTLMCGFRVRQVADTTLLGRNARETILHELFEGVVPFVPTRSIGEPTPISLVL